MNEENKIIERGGHLEDKKIYYNTLPHLITNKFGRYSNRFQTDKVCKNLGFVAFLPYKARIHGREITWWLGGKRIIAAGSNGDLICWNGGYFNLDSSTRIGSVPDSDTSKYGLTTLAAEDSNPVLLTGQENGFIKYVTPDFDITASIPAHKETVTSITISSNGDKFASSSSDAKIKIFDLNEAKEESSLSRHENNDEESQHRWNVTSLKWHPVMNLVVSGSMDNTIRLWDPREKQLVTTLRHHKHKVTSVSLNSRYGLLSGSLDFSAKLMDLRMPEKELISYKDNLREVVKVSFNPKDESRFALSCTDGSIAFYHCLKETATKRIQFAHDHIVHGLDWHPDGELLATCSQDSSAKVWGPVDKERIHFRYDFNDLDEAAKIKAIEGTTEEMGPYSLQVRKMKKYMIEQSTTVKISNIADVDLAFDEFFNVKSIKIAKPVLEVYKYRNSKTT